MIEQASSESEVELGAVLDALMSERKFLLIIVFSFFLFGTAGVMFLPPKYQADALVQVEDISPGLGLAGPGELFSGENSIGAEIEIIRSRSVLGQVVAELNLQSELTPIFFPGAYGLEARGLLESLQFLSRVPFLESFNWALPVVSIRRYEVSPADTPTSLSLVVRGDRSYDVYCGSGVAAAGQVGRLVEFTCEDTQTKHLLNIRSLKAKEGARFSLGYRPKSHVVRSLKQQLSVYEVGRETGIIRISMAGDNRREIEEIINAVATTYLRQNIERKSAEARQSVDFLAAQMPIVRGELESAERRLASFRENNKTIDLSIETEAILDKMVVLDQKLSELDLRRSELLQSYTNDHPIIDTLNDQRRKLLEERSNLVKKTASLPDIQQDLLRLVREVEVSTELYTFMLNKLQELKVVQAGTIGDVRIIDEAASDPEDKRFGVSVGGGVGALFGLLIGVFFVFLKKALQSGITDPEVIESTLSSPVYAVLPLSEAKREGSARHKLVTEIDGVDSVLAESFRSMRTSLHFALGGKKAGVVLAISGPSPGVGKTFVSTNLADFLAESGNSVLYVDADMRRGDAHAVYGFTRSPGLSEALVDKSHDVVRRLEKNERLSVITRGKSPPNASELLLSEEFEKLVDSWRETYDYVVIDTPPVLAVTDPVLVSNAADALFLVGRAGKTTLAELAECQRRISKGGSEIKGVIVNGMTKSLAGAGKYGQNYGYYNYAYTSADK